MTGAGGPRIGADAAALDELAVALRAGAALLSSTGSWRPSALWTWHGPDAEATLSLLGEVAAQRRRAAAVLDGCAATVARAAVDQRRASLAGPAVTVRVDVAGAGGRLV